MSYRINKPEMKLFYFLDIHPKKPKKQWLISTFFDTAVCLQAAHLVFGAVSHSWYGQIVLWCIGRAVWAQLQPRCMLSLSATCPSVRLLPWFNKREKRHSPSGLQTEWYTGKNADKNGIWWDSSLLWSRSGSKKAKIIFTGWELNAAKQKLHLRTDWWIGRLCLW